MKQKTVDKHHRIPRSLAVEGEPNVIVRVSAKKHRSWHNLFANMTPEQICAEINAKWGDFRYVFEAKRK